MADSNTIGGLHYEMMRRCYNEKSIAYGSYGAKGITVCPEWHDKETFRKWCLDNGWKKGFRIERIDCKLGYEPSNCRFGQSCVKNIGNNKIAREKHERITKIRESYGVPAKYSKLRIYRIYTFMHRRCEDPKHDHYKSYGARGISVCDEWSGKYGFFAFYKWSIENGYKDGLSIDRIDNNKGYSPDNCRWVTPIQQIYNKQNTIYYDYLGIKVSLGVIARNENVKYKLLYRRVRQNGMTVSEALADIKQKYS